MDENQVQQSQMSVEHSSAETLICPRGYIYRHESGKELFANWVHVLLPHKAVTVYDQNGNTLLMEDREDMLELYCKVSRKEDQLQ